MSNVRFAVLGDGNTHWMAPTRPSPSGSEAALLAAGATPIVPRGEVDATGDFDGMATRWMDTLWTTLAEEYGADTSADDRPALPGGGAHRGGRAPRDRLRAGLPAHRRGQRGTRRRRDRAVGLQHRAAAPAAKSITIELPDGVTYETGNHLAVFAKNDPALVNRALRLLRRRPRPGGPAAPRGRRRRHPPAGRHARDRGAAAHRVPGAAGRGHPHPDADAGRAHRVPVDPTAAAGLHGDTDEAEERYQTRSSASGSPCWACWSASPPSSCRWRSSWSMMGPIRPRFYSISSAPLVNPRHVATDRRPAGRSGPVRRRPVPRPWPRTTSPAFEPGDVFYGYVRVPSPPFAPPADPATPLILIGPGTGIAPLRGFLEERAAAAGERHRGRSVAGLRRLPPPGARLLLPARRCRPGSRPGSPRCTPPSPR